jgi:ribokinase
MVLVVSFGSLNVDLAVRLPRWPAPDETLEAVDVAEFLGGKGANQATAAARLGAESHMVGRVGTDGHGDAVLAGLARNGVGYAHVGRAGAHTGLAIPLVADGGDSAIVIAAGANGCVTVEDADAAGELLARADVLLLQGEVASDASARAAQLTRRAGGMVVASPAPVRPDARLMLDEADVVLANRTEAAALGLVQAGVTGTAQVVITLGAEGARVGDTTVPAFPARLVDPIGAGDAFAAAVAVALAEGLDLVDAVRFGCAAGACAVEVAGAEPSFPRRTDVEARLAGIGPR